MFNRDMTRRISLTFLMLLVLLAGRAAQAQSPPPRADHQFWSELQLTKPINKKQDIVIFGVVRLGQNRARPVDERAGLGYAFKVSPHLTIMPTYLHVEYQPYPGKIIHEERLILKATLKGNLGKFLFTDRNLYERRLRPGTADFNVYRNRLQIDHPVQALRPATGERPRGRLVPKPPLDRDHPPVQR